MNDIIVRAAIEAHCERQNRFTQTALIYLGQNSLSGYCPVLSRLTAMAFYDVQIFHGDSHGNTQMICVQRRAVVVNLELTWQHLLSGFRPK